jgi:acetolactate synthase-1/2/3 large subunit
MKFGRYTSSGHLNRVDHAVLARACGATGDTITDPDELQDALRAGLESGRPTLIDLITDPGAHPPLSLYADTLDRHEHGTIIREPVP